MKTESSLGTTLAALGIALACAPAHGMEAAALKGAWLGTEQGYPIKHALIVEGIENSRDAPLKVYTRIGATGYAAKQLMLDPVTFERRSDAGPLELVAKTRRAEIVLRPDGERLRSIERNLESAVEREVAYERVDETQLAKAQFNRIPMAKATEVTVIYMGTPDCTWCVKWEALARPVFMGSDHFKWVRFLEVKGSNLRSGVTESNFPEKDRNLGRQITVGSRVGVPSFALAVDGRLVLLGKGSFAWDHRVDPLARALAAWKSAAKD